MVPVARTTVSTTASAATVDRLLTDTTAWQVWSPHVAEVSASDRYVTAGWRGDVRAFFSPVATTMRVTWAQAGRGYDWESTLGPWTLRYGNRVEPTADGARLEWSAFLAGPGLALIVPLVRALSALGQRRRILRLARTAEIVEDLSGPSSGSGPPR